MFNDLTVFFETKYFGNTTTAWLIALGLFVVAVIIIAAVKAFFLFRLTKRAQATATEIDDVIVDLVARTRLFFYALLSLHAAAQSLVLPARVHHGLQFLTLAAVLLQIVVWGSGLIDYFVKRYTRQHSTGDRSGIATIRALGFAARFVLLTIVILIALQNLDYDITALVAGLGIGGIAIALAIQNILGDLFAALSIMVDKPFVIGDTITIDDLSGSVEHIGLKTTRIRSITGEQLIIANGDLLKSRIRNLRRMRERRVVFTVKVPYETTRQQIETIPTTIRQIIESQKNVRFDRSHFLTFSESSLNIETVYFMLTPDYMEYADTQQAINLALMEQFEISGIEFAYPKPTMILQQAEPAS